MANPSTRWDFVPVFGVYLRLDDTPSAGRITFTMPSRVTRIDGRVIYPEGASITVTIGDTTQQDSAIRSAVRAAWRAADEAAQGAEFDGVAWDTWWDDVVVPAAIFTSFPASDDPDIVQQGWSVSVSEDLTSGKGKSYAIQPLLAHLDQPIPGINLGTIEVPPGSPTVPAPMYAKGIAGGVAALDADGDVVDAGGNKIVEAAEAAAAAAEAAAVAALAELEGADDRYAARSQGILAGAPKLTRSHVIHRDGMGFRWSSQADESYVTFLSFYHVFYTAYKTTGAMYAISRPTIGGTLQHVWRSTDGGDTWAKMFELTINQASGVWYENIFVEPYYETVYLQKTTTGFNRPYSGVVESYTSAGVLIGSRTIGDSRWLSGSHSIDYCPNTQHVVIFGEYASDTKPTVNLWRTANKGLTWTSVLAEPGNNGGVSGAVRHFHAVAADPYTKHWWAASGDADGQCRIYRSTDDGLTWNVLFQGTQHERTTSFVFTADHVYYGTDYPASTPDHSKLVRITKADLTRTDVATIKNGFPVWALTKTFSPEGILIWPSCEYRDSTPQDHVTVQFYDLNSGKLTDVARFSIEGFSSGTEGIHSASRHQDVATGNILYMPTTNVQRRGGFDTTIVSAFSRGQLLLPSGD